MSHFPLSLDAVSKLLGPVLPAFQDVAHINIEQLTGGVSNLTYRAVAKGQTAIVRLPPPGRKAKTAHDMVREAKLIEAIRQHYPYCPNVLGIVEEADPPWFAMEEITGVIARRPLNLRLEPAQAHDLCDSFIARFVELHAIDIDASGLASLGRAEGYIARQISGWSRRYRDVRTDDVRSGERVMSWLERHRPAESDRCVIHNDFKLDNMVLDPADPTNIIGVLDWEMATVGDPLMDLGASLAYWVEREDSLEMRSMARLPTLVPGMMTRKQVVARYAELSGRPVGDFNYYYVYGLFRLAAIAQQIYYRYVHGQSTDERFAGFGKAVNTLIQHAESVINTHEREANKSMQHSKLLSSDAFRLDGKVAIVSGASRGIGEAVARLLAAHGAHVVVSSRRQESCETVASSIREAGGEATAIACHVGKQTERAALISRTVESLGRLDILINNAGTNPYFGSIVDTPVEAFDKTIEVNLRGFFQMTQLAVKAMRESGGGAIVNTSSINGVKPAQGQGIYSVTKAAVISMTQAFAKECAGLNIRVNAILPGLTDTKLASALTQNPALLKMILPMIPMGRVAAPEEIAPAFLLLCSDAGAYITGATLAVDGGFLA
jgi:aminoglycoside phosphotransferase (APT) family kinase protein/NAD(P)-dependent dehydrogenase (short-subunit alcohol dehydrogenase family)